MTFLSIQNNTLIFLRGRGGDLHFNLAGFSHYTFISFISPANYQFARNSKLFDLDLLLSAEKNIKLKLRVE